MAKKPTPTKKVEEPKVETKKAEDQKKSSSEAKTVEVKNLTKSRFVQPSTKTTLWPGGTKPMNNDGWLKNQVEAGLLEIV